ncbi:DUF4013 domain-containing protein [Halobellus limi]|uniref:DUF4013 domain-containing protein n=1 Tax=Halobellus limi TaxID=699433 RepID=A0A1H6AL01_9EURY|nr:DUF4013 domain-containing protein [Halobellus limi]QCC47618.1 DUF4013 domain-containing protein [Halobellus limi]SEG48705.1 Protein of unknown function [Halobellus limi]
MLSDALSYPLNGDSPLRTILVGGLLSLLTVFVIPVFFLQGYYVRILRGASSGDSEPPTFSDWGDLLVDGLKLFAVNLLVSLVVLVVMFVVAAIFGAGSLLSGAGPAADPGAGVGGIFAVFGVLGFLLFVAVVLAVGFVAPGMFANFAREDSIAAAFDVSTIIDGVTTSEYLVAWVLAVVVGLVLGSIASLLSVVVVGIFGLFYVQVVTYYLFGRGFAAGLDEKRGGAATTY